LSIRLSVTLVEWIPGLCLAEADTNHTVSSDSEFNQEGPVEYGKCGVLHYGRNNTSNGWHAALSQHSAELLVL